MITLYSGPLSLFTAKVRIALAEKGIDYNRIEVAFGREATLFAASLGAAPPAELKTLNRWLARIDARPSVAAELAELTSWVAAVSS